ncbi:hypothetical protein ACIBG7_39080 [Nonomuraea sp. NPDC050328]|uniref:hypothetical protein n=1 Tax=Nonomuraea sp. NPDC050328 TaxID=3364361 RepID=UPI0037A10539
MNPRPWPLIVLACLLALASLAGGGFAATAVGAELTRGPTGSELVTAARAEVAERWRSLPAGQVFPESIEYTAEQGGRERARRIGISPDTSCQAAVDERAEKILTAAQCRAVLRATYLDALGGVLVTVGVVVLPDDLHAARVRSAFPQDGRPAPGVRALAFKGTVSDRFTDAVRQASSARYAGPYVVLTTAGQVDGRPAKAVGGQRPGVFAFARELSDRILGVLTEPKRPVCGTKEWRC